MSARRIILVLLALVVAGVTAQFTRALMDQQTRVQPQAAAPQPAAAPAMKVLVAETDLPAGALLQPGHLVWRAWPKDAAAERLYVVEGARPLEDFHGAVVRQGVRAGEPITDAQVVRKGDRGFLAAVLSPGMRAVSVPINGVTGVAGFIFPGDRVDLVLTLRVEHGEESAMPERRASETVLSGVRVLALDQRSDDLQGEVKVAQIATLEVSPREAERVALAADLGRLSLSLRPLEADPAESGVEIAMGGGGLDSVLDLAATPAPAPAPSREPKTITWDFDVSLAVAGPAALEEPAAAETNVNQTENAGGLMTVKVVRGVESAEIAFPKR